MLKTLLQLGRMALTMLLLAALARPALADDIDLFSGNAGTTDIPNVILLLDNSANWSSTISMPDCFYVDNGVTTTDGPKFSSPGKEQGKKVALQKCALYNVLDTLPVKSDGGALFNIAIMLLNESPASNAGGYPRKAFTPLSATNKAAVKALIKSLSIDDDKANNASFAKGLYEAYLYFAGDTPYKGTAGIKWDTAAVAGGRYISPAAASCGRNYVILIANGSPESAENNDALALLGAKGGNTAQINYPTGYVSTSDQHNWSDEMARFMAGQDVSSMDGTQNVITFTIAITGSSSDGLYPNFMKGIAKAGGGDACKAATALEMTGCLTAAFNQMQAVNSVFSSVSLPASVSVRGSFLNQVYMGVFRPDANAKPRWRGNLKQYKFNYDPVTDSLSLYDSAGHSAVSSVTGFIVPSAVSYWTQPSSFWVNEPLGTPSSASDSPDGYVVEKGGAAQQIRTVYAQSQSSRKLYTCIACTTTPVDLTGLAQDFSSANTGITAAMLGTTSADRSNLIGWIRGTDNVPGDEMGPGAPTTVRPSVHGDVLHSPPLALNYNSNTDHDIVVYYGSNDGALRAIHGGQSGPDAGKEMWSFIPEEHFGKFKRLRDNWPEVRLPTTPASLVSALPRDYFVDGPISAYQKFNTDGSINTAYLYVTMRRGGRVLYALDVTNPNAPRFLWKKNDSDTSWTVAGTTYAIGQTWSEPKLAAAMVNGVSTKILVMGAGYDPAAEDTIIPGTTTMGNAVLVLDATSGALLKAFPTVRSVAADVTLIDSNGDGLVDRIYAVDVGGHLYRIDLGTDSDTAVINWGIYQLAALAGGGIRKFFFAPDVVLTDTFSAVMVGSGDREKPLRTTVAGSDAFFTVYDPRLIRGTPVAAPPVIDSSNLGLVGSSQIMGFGCYIPMGASEKVVNAPITVLGTTYFSTNAPTQPSANTCSSNLGRAKLYTAPTFCQAPTHHDVTGGGLPPSAQAGIVHIDYVLPDGTTVFKDIAYIIGAPNAKNSPIEVSKTAERPLSSVNRRRLYWFLEGAR